MTLVPFDDRDGWIWWNGSPVPWRDAGLHVLSHGLHYASAVFASAVFEGERAWHGNIFRLRDHSDRLLSSARILGFEIPWPAEQADARPRNAGLHPSGLTHCLNFRAHASVRRGVSASSGRSLAVKSREKSMTAETDTDVVVIGAGCAGLGAATFMGQAGRRCVVLEASDRVGGRAWTTYPKELGGVWFDMGAVWFHDAEHNPLVRIAEAAGETLLRSDELRSERTFVGGRLATPAELASYDTAWSRFEAAADALLARHDDVPLAAVTRSLPEDPWAATVEAWEGPVICVADGDRFSARDWRSNALGGSNLLAEGGIGAFVRRRCAAGLDIRLATPVTRVVWGGPKGRVKVDTATGSFTASACIVTVSTGVLASGALRFDPPLPPAVQESVHALPMGLAVKVALRASGPDRLDLPRHCSVDRQVAREGDTLMPFQCWPFGRDYVQGWIGGGMAWELARAGDAAVADFALAQLRALFGSRVDGLFAGGDRLVTHWDAEPWVRGSYCYAETGGASARRRLAEPLADGHLLFAGEACHIGFAGTVAGAWISGQAAAGVVAKALAAHRS